MKGLSYAYLLIIIFSVGIKTANGSSDENYSDDAKVCPRDTCRHKCEKSKYPASNCHCDEDCLYFRDCCPDYALYCVDSKGAAEKNQTTFTNLVGVIEEYEKQGRSVFAGLHHIKRTDLACKKLQTGKNTETPVLMIVNCAGAFQINPLDKERCENTDNYTSSTDIGLISPVFYRGLVFRNHYCLRCNVGGVNRSEVVLASPSYVCHNSGIQSKAIQLYEEDGFEAFMNYLIANCAFQAKIDGIFPSIPHLKNCIVQVDSCDISYFTGSRNSFEAYQALCSMYTSPVTATAGGIVYKNVHCSMCNGFNDTECYSLPVTLAPQFSPRSGIVRRLPSFSLLLDFDGGETGMTFGGKRYCKPSEMLDVANDVCLKRPCPEGYIPLDNTCFISHASDELKYVDFFDRNLTRLIIETEVSDDPLRKHTNESLYLQELVSDIMVVLDGKYNRNVMFQSADLSCDMRPSDNVDSNVNATITTASKIRFCIHFTMNRIISNFPYSKNKLEQWETDIQDLWSKNRRSFRLLKAFILNYLPPGSHSKSPVCQTGIPTVTTDVVFSKLGDKHGQLPTHLIDNTTGLSYDYSKVPIGAIFSIAQSVKFNLKYFALVCRPPILQCGHVILNKNKTDVSWHLNGTTLHLGSLKLKQGSYADDDDQIVICRDTFDLIFGSQNSPPSVDSMVQGILTMIGNILSPVFLIFTFITYCLFRSMRTVPGLCIMNLCVSLSSAQILFQLGPLLSGWKTACLVAAAFQHYMWLVSFLWMNVLAYITCKTFTGRGAGGVCEKSGFRRYLVYAWIVPLVFVGTCVAVDLLTTLPFSYGGGSQCWLTGKTGLIYFFAVPLAIIIAVNLVLFSHTLVAIKRTMDVAKQAKEKADDQQRFVIYVKLSSVMGFTWLFGFLANLTVLNVLWYVFIVLNTSQGVFIAMSFVLTRRVMKKYKALFTGERVDSNSSSRSGATRSTKASVSAISER